jgi:hypothetical protein
MTGNRMRCLVVLLRAAALGPVPSLAWGQLGHRLVASLAAARLTPQARVQVAGLLAGERLPTLAGVSGWADDLRTTDPQRFKATSAWHYIDSRDRSCRFVLPRDCPDGNCVVAAIESQRKVLADASQPVPARRDALKFLVHLVADVHQPLHASNHDDSGGNGFDIQLRTDIRPESSARGNYANGVMKTNLHAVWDFYVLASARAGPAPYLERLQPRLPAVNAARIGTPLSWAEESCGLIDSLQLYPRRHSLDHAYLKEMRPVAERRIEMAAVRLAALLNAALSGS